MLYEDLSKKIVHAAHVVHTWRLCTEMLYIKN